MTGEGPSSDEERRVEELLRVNSELAAEIRSLVSGRTSEPRSSARPSARRVSRLADERDELEAKLEASRAEHGRLEQHNQDLGRQIHEQSRHIEQLGGEIARLRGGAAGFLRRLRARALRRG